MSLLNFTEEHDLFRKTVKQFVEKEIRPNVEQWELEGKTPRHVWERAGELGFLGLTYPEEYGGMNADYLYTLILSEELARCDSPGVSLGLAVQTDMATPAIAHFGNEFLKRNYLEPAIRGKMICSIAVTEPGCGSDVAGIRTKAVKHGDSYLINGTKMFITNGTQADFLTLLARTSDAQGHGGFSLFVVPTSTHGFSVGRSLKKISHLSSDTAEIVLEDVRVSEEHRIGDEGKGFVYQMKQFQFERLAGAFQMLGAMKRCYELTKTYIQQRETFGQALASYQVTKHKMAQMLAEIMSVEALAQYCVSRVQAGGDFTRDTSILKLIAAQTQMRVSNECCQLHGGYGLMSEYAVARYYRDSKLSEIGGGSNEVMKEIIAKMEGFR
ncbi:MAG: acyl-CoA dehydrogenase family protein [SAR324 cluster bacterium]|nr:acyl-CoA dehydrogenase family protein [SAR324 cluster bacterium]